MSVKALPLLFINLGGEMVYILHQRLRAQNIDSSKSKKVLTDIVGTMFNSRFMEELFKPQELHSKKAMRTVFDRLAHASIMRLNAASMDKLYDLMTMAVKYQVTLTPKPSDVVMVTLNHVDAIRELIKDQSDCMATMDSLFNQILMHYKNLSDGEFAVIRQSLLAFCQDMQVRVSIFLKERQQHQSGRFILPSGGDLPWGSDYPGKITFFDSKGNVERTKNFPVSSCYKLAPKQGSTEKNGDRVTKLGLNMYGNTKPSDTVVSDSGRQSQLSHAPEETTVPNPLAKAQLDLLSRLIGSGPTPQNNFRLNFFRTDEEEENYTSPICHSDSTEFVSIDASKRRKDEHLEHVMGEMSVSSSSKGGGIDLLDLMDS